MSTELAALTETESSELSFCESLIEKNLTSFVDCGNALLKINDQRLYRADFPDFKAYLRERWQIGRSHAYRLMDAAKIAQTVPEVETERQARELGQYEKEVQAIVFQIAKATAPVIDGKPSITAGHLKAVGDVLTGVVDGGGLADSSGEMQPLGTLLKASITEEVFERMKRQEEIIKEKRDNKTRAAVSRGDSKAVPALPAANVLMSIVRDLVKGIERMNVDRGEKMHPALANPYHFGKAFIGEPLGELSVLPDDVAMIGICTSCSTEDVAVRDVVLTITNNSIKSLRAKLCDPCIAKYQRIIEAVPEVTAA